MSAPVTFSFSFCAFSPSNTRSSTSTLCSLKWFPGGNVAMLLHSLHIMKNLVGEFYAQLVPVLPEITIKTEPPDFNENCDLVFDTSDPLNNGSHEVYTVNTAALQKGAKKDEANLKLWSPHGLFPEFSSYVQPLLHGATMTARRHKALSCALRDEIIKFLNKNKLIQNTNTSVMRWEYCALGRSLAARYPNLVWDHPKPGTQMPDKQKNPWSLFMRRLTATRKALKWRVIKKKLQDSNSTPTTAAS
ncbi:uncharacterized protein LOC119396337 [Rhipicephalus sanguineus]|uniref:uncharacterized protein LOC119396337 n=1 Tax=Rhipicephalus sanguineus TaxID=34632 RepID=UPI001893FECB|nr:uncharacterized protein LOC119396337 [Rhipicephalus sanguineus]